ncbi:cytochrome c3 family protein [Campylobacter pinnipediorum]|uniref:cytochrome c3 family protein n=1 Tax=Campylobacter pinnipediorum TaxID=1965231 RepID=UPI000995124C|nr:cytochrome c3 [Campylobacter pinnipediorum subsp. pinnipediorum]
MKFKTFCIIMFLFACLSQICATDQNTTKIQISKEMMDKHPIKPHHANISLTCINCHQGQGNDVTKFKAIGDKGCISCHGDKKRVAQRLEYMDMLKANPHNSIHDGPTLFCDECHNEHKKSTNMCLECHESEVKHWMRVTP